MSSISPTDGGGVLPCIIVHGGAFSIDEPLRAPMLAGVQQAAEVGYAVLAGGGSAMDAAEAAVRSLESDPCFDAGIGSVLNEDGAVEMDALFVDGATLKFGAVAGVSSVEHPITLARAVMERTAHVMLAGAGADKFAREIGMPAVGPDVLVTPAARADWEEIRQARSQYDGSVQRWFAPSGHDTVGAVAMDTRGHICAATSTGGITFKRAGRVGDSPLIGCGAFADDAAGGVSSTGHGESIARVLLAQRAALLMAQGHAPAAACRLALQQMRERTQGAGGLIAVSARGELGWAHTTAHMAWACVQGDGRRRAGLTADGGP